MTQFTRATKVALTAGVLALAAAGAAQAASPELGRAGVLQAVIDCRQVADSAERLTCYDRAAAALDAAEAKGEVVVMDREQTRRARREAFGFSLPSLDIFNRGEEPEKIEKASFKVVRAWRNSDGKWAFEVDSGAVWRQTDNEQVKVRDGSTVEIRAAALSSYLAKVDGQLAIRVRRER